MAKTVQLDEDHPGFHDEGYRERRDHIAKVGHNYISGTEVPVVPYIPEEHHVWSLILTKLHPVHKELACEAYLKCRRELLLPTERIPQLQWVSDLLKEYTGFVMEPVPGLVTPRAFLEGLARRSMLSTQYIRHHSVPEYTPEPDVIHEILGHAVFLADKEYALVNELFGRVAVLSTDDEIIQLIALYWHTIEFGICYEGGHIKAYGAGLLSSAGEMKRMTTVPHLLFDVHVMEETEFETTHFQSRLFCAESYGDAMAKLRLYLTNLYETRRKGKERKDGPVSRGA